MRKKDEVRKRLTEIKKHLDTQVQEKRLAKQNESYVNEQYMKQWTQMAEDDESKRKEKEEQGRQKKLLVKDFLLMQMGSSES